jgi:hypothetical protein
MAARLEQDAKRRAEAKTASVGGTALSRSAQEILEGSLEEIYHFLMYSPRSSKPRVIHLPPVADVRAAPSDDDGPDERDFDEELAERLLSKSMDRLAMVARDIDELVAQTAIDLAMIETKRIQIDRAQAENWALLRELTEERNDRNRQARPGGFAAIGTGIR